ncbi:BT1A1 protein, partial [Asarcornis scutulata]|nr:BT1A1 protein [Asarcornis scutulata]
LFLAGEVPITISIDPSVVCVGEQVTLSCQLTHSVPSDTGLLWYKKEKERDTPLCSSSSLGGVVEQCQDEEWCRIKGRWERRSLLLIIQQVQVTDEGEYICAVSGSAGSQEAVTHLDVTALGNKPTLERDQQEEGMCRYTCKSKGWNPKPEVLWTNYGESNKNVEARTYVTWNETDLFSLQSIMTVPCDDVDVKCVVTLVKEKISRTVSQDAATPLEELANTQTSLQTISEKLHTLQESLQTLETSREQDLQILREEMEGRISKDLEAAKKSWTKESLLEMENKLGEQKFHSSSLLALHYLTNYLIIAVDVTLDADTAHPRLQVSEDGKSVTDTGVIRRVPVKEERFDSHAFVLAKEGYTSGRLYWEVDVGKRRNWILGVAQETVTRKGTVVLSPQNGFWVIELADEQEYVVHTNPWTHLTVSGRPQKIGMFLDISAKKLSFYIVHQKKVLYTFKFGCDLSQEVRLFPFFSTGS